VKRIIKVKVYPDSKKEYVEEEKGRIHVWTREPAQDNRANKDCIRLLSFFLQKEEGSLRIIKGHHQRNKTIEIIQ
jgi:uncharacterized protein YggU (UPF0235/DUF167 family)